jgi:hypothetical protein
MARISDSTSLVGMVQRFALEGPPSAGMSFRYFRLSGLFG